MRPITETLPFAEALRIVMTSATPLARTERVPLVGADGRVVAIGVVSDLDVPPFDRAAMDGYAVLAQDTAGAGVESPVRLRLIGQVFTGRVSAAAVEPGTCIEIATGAPLPTGADAVVMVEHTARHDNEVSIHRRVQPRQHVGKRGGDIGAGQAVVCAGDVLTPGRVGAIAALGHTSVEVFAKPRVAIMCTGDEVIEPGRPLGPGQLYNVNRFTLDAVIRRHGGEPVVIPTTLDTMDALTASLNAAKDCDLIVSSGGSSAGEHDLVIDLLRARGRVLFHGIAVKPGMPTVFGHIDRALLLGLSGYPTSCLSNAHVLLVPLLRLTARLPPWIPRTVDVPLARPIASPPGRHQFYTVRLVDGQAEPAFKASGDITSMAHADGYVEIPASMDIIEAGTVVTVKLF